MDGVICHTDAYHYKAWLEIARALDVPFTPADNNQLRGVSRMESLEILLKHYTGPPLSQGKKNRLAAKKNRLYRKMLKHMTPADLDKEVKTVLLALRAAGCKLAIGSSSRNAPLILRRIGLEGFFDAVVDGNCITHSKPHPEVFLKAAKALGLAPGQCLVVEDATAGIDSALAGGFDAAAIGAAAGDVRAACSLHSLAGLLGLLSENQPEPAC